MDTNVDAVFLTPASDGIEFLPDGPGIYCALNRATRMINIGQAENLRRRCVMHRSQLRAGTAPNMRMRRDAERYGADTYFYYVLQEIVPNPKKPLKRMLNQNEVWWVVHLQAHDERYGYVSEAGGCRTRGSRFRDRESKLMRHNSQKYALLPGVDLYDPINHELLASWVPGS
ncbi:hypothetical protein [Rhodoferax sp.]|uniref:hypothetical protein n=1 Tax=Rhodoferax sp. TaxID=50421 RepID=UPI0025FADF2D|nr:hypothetical protein [Rhodoferax sp.]MCM2342185.1 hypothetical protein [Rhodoferax sp.]